MQRIPHALIASCKEALLLLPPRPRPRPPATQNLLHAYLDLRKCSTGYHRCAVLSPPAGVGVARGLRAIGALGCRRHLLRDGTGRRLHERGVCVCVCVLVVSSFVGGCCGRALRTRFGAVVSGCYHLQESHVFITPHACITCSRTCCTIIQPRVDFVASWVVIQHAVLIVRRVV